ncbi:MAG TPA: chorismate-binding protein [Gemmatimonadales bacterium]|nr:chorismate-binding protein [Gemmatimonadales bacterium]
MPEYTERSVTVVPVVRQIVLDTDQPVSALAKLARGPFAFLLESAAGLERWARYTFMGTEPRQVWRWRGGRLELRDSSGAGWQDAGPCADPIGELARRMRSRRAEAHPSLPRFFGGAVGYLGYDVVRTLERLGDGPPPPADPELPDAVFMLADTVVVLDNLLSRALLVANVELEHGAGAQERAAAMRAAEQRLEELAGRLRGPSPLDPLAWIDDPPPAGGTSSYGEARFMADVARLKEHIAAGDIFQGVLSRRVDVPGHTDPLRLYRYLRALNPAPYLYYLKLDDLAIVGSSPEVLVRVEDGTVTVRPIAGTRPRGSTVAEDERLARELASDPKEIAEHLMLLDLGRNDVGRVAAFGTVEVAERMNVERYSHVQHLVSEVRGRLPRGRDALDALRATFPAGTVTGAPKVRAMQLIDSLEPVRRGPYAGAVGYVGWGAERLDTAIAIRTCIVLKDRVLVQAGAGVVADSDPARELAETQHKAGAALRAITLAQRDFRAV